MIGRRSHHLLLITTCFSFILGIALSSNIDLPPPLARSILSGTLLCLCLFFISKCKPLLSSSLLLLLFFLAGGLAGHQDSQAQLPPHHLHHLITDKKDCVVIGKIRRIQRPSTVLNRFDVQANQIQCAQTKTMCTTGIIRFTVKDTLPPSILPGDTVAVRARVKPPGRYNTPGSFDYPGYLAQQNIYTLGYLPTSLYVQPVVDRKEVFSTLPYLPERIRTSIIQFLDNNLEKRTSSIYRALLTGDRTAISPNLKEQFIDAGCLHILAISGLHMSLLGFFLYSSIYWLLRRSESLILCINVKKGAAILCVIPLTCYAFMAGAQPPVLRALLMSLLIILCLCVDRIRSFYTILALAAFLLLCHSPQILFTPSFQLTFCGIIFITLSIPLISTVNTSLASLGLQNIFLRLAQWIIGSILVSTAATLGCAPLLIYHFNRVSLIGVISNLFIEPLLCFWSLPIGFLGIVFMIPLPIVSTYLFKIGALGIHGTTGLVSQLSSIPGNSFYLPDISILHLLVYLLVLILLFRCHTYKRVYRIFLCTTYMFLSGMLFFSASGFIRGNTHTTSISCLDVGQGSCTLLQLPGGHTILIDGGGIVSPEFDIGKEVIAQFLYRKRISSLDGIIITHPDSDHYNGINHLLKHFRVGKLWISEHSSSPGWSELIRTANNHDVKIIVPHTPGSLFKQGDIDLHLVSGNFGSRRGKTTNDNGLVIIFRQEKFSMLFPGDISKEKELALLQSGIDFRADVLLAAHHGSSGSNSEEFLRNINPRYVVVSSGRSRRLKFPSASLVEHCYRFDRTLLPIGGVGSVFFEIKRGKYSVNTFLSGNSQLLHIP